MGAVSLPQDEWGVDVVVATVVDELPPGIEVVDESVGASATTVASESATAS